jgi:hypothetical protein
MPKVPSEETKHSNSLLYIMKFSTNTSVPHQKSGDHVKERDSNVKGNIMSKSMICTLKTVVIKHAEQTIVKQQAIQSLLRQTFEGGNKRTRKLCQVLYVVTNN